MRFEAMMVIFSLVQSLSYVRLFVILWTAACQASLSITNSQSLLKLMSMLYFIYYILYYIHIHGLLNTT